MNALMQQFRAMPSANLRAYLFGFLAIVFSQFFFKELKPSYLESQVLIKEHQNLERMVQRFDASALQTTIDDLHQQQEEVKAAILKNIPVRQLEETLPSLLESLHALAKANQLEIRRLAPSDVTQNAEIATATVSIVAIGLYQNLYRWIQAFIDSTEGISVSQIKVEQAPNTQGKRTMEINLVIYGL